MTTLQPPIAHFWCEREEEYLELLHKTCLELAEVYRQLYVDTSKIQNKLRLPAIILSSLSGAASFGSSSFAASSANPLETQGNINIAIGIVNVFIAMIQTYESFKKIGETVSKSISTCIALKKLSEDIHCVVFIPPGDRDTAGVMYLRDAFNRYQSIMDQAPPLDHATKDHLRFKDVSNKITVEIKKQNRTMLNSQITTTSLPFTQYNVKNRNPSSDSYISSDDRDHTNIPIQNIDSNRNKDDTII
jgi:hypothetical protein